jgi:hypothetical protein
MLDWDESCNFNLETRSRLPDHVRAELLSHSISRYIGPGGDADQC